MPSGNDSVIRRLYEAMDAHDGDSMAALYAADARLEDPVFGPLTGEEAGNMWRLLTSRSKDLRVELAEHGQEGDRGTARWVASYTFTPTGRAVTNDIRASFRFRDGLIVEHVDRFDFWRWSRQALGPPGLLLGWTPLLRKKVGGQARAGLDKFMAEDA